MRIFLDTNVLVSAFATRGLCTDVVRTIFAEHDLVTGEFVLAELEEVLLNRFGLPEERISAIIKLLRRYDVVPIPKKPPDIHVRDPDDLWVLASALASGADLLVTGDQDLLSIKDKIDIVITDPRGFWTMIKEQKII